MFPLRLLSIIDRAWLAARQRRSDCQRTTTAGAGIHGSQFVDVISTNEIFWPCFPTMAHSFWRAQEVTLFRRHQHLIRGKVLDLGCGDGIFGSAAGFSDRTTGVDFDQPSLDARRKLLPEAESVWGDASSLPLGDGSFDCVVSNSVMEHLPNLSACISEAHRVLRPSGRFLFTMTMGEFTSQLERLTGRLDAELWCNRFGHLQEPTRATLLELLTSSDFVIEEVFEYQPEKVTATYRRLLSPAFQFVERRQSIERRRIAVFKLSAEVVQSLEGSEIEAGGCVWITARKR